MIIFIKGLIIGGTMLVPGVSGGTMAMILGVYDKLIFAVSSFGKNKARNLRTLAIAAIGGIIGIYLLSKPIEYLLATFTVPTLYFFTGAVVGSIPMIYRKSLLNKFSYRGCAYILLGVMIVFGISIIPTGLMDGSDVSLLIIVFAGIIAAIALVLPGISVSYLLLVIGVYDNTMVAVSDLNFSYLLPLGIGLLMGIMLFTRILEKAMDKHPQPTYLIILGFVVGSLYEVFPGIPTGQDLIISAVTFIVGILIIIYLTNLSNSSSKLD